MILTQWFKKLLPKQERFYAILCEQVRVLHHMTEYLQSFDDPKQSDNEAFYLHCHEIEHEGDALVKEMATALAKTFITPLDREDLYHLSVLIENSLNACDQAARQFKLLSHKANFENIHIFLTILHESANYLIESIDALVCKKFQIILANDEKIKQLEKKADHHYREQITDLFNNCDDIKLLFIQKEVIEKLEEATNVVAHLSVFLTNLTIKYG